MADEKPSPFVNPWPVKETQAAAPAGFSQVVEDGGPKKGPFGNLFNATAYEDAPFTYASQEWLTGANRAGIGNGWDTDFGAKVVEQHTEALEGLKDNPDAFEDWLKRDDANAVVTWGERREEGDTSVDEAKFGDVYRDGRWVGNVYQDYEKADADLLMSQRMLDPKTQAHIFAKGVGTATALADEVEKQRGEWTEGLQANKDQQAYVEDVQTEQRKQQEAGVGGLLTGLAAIGTGLLTGAATGAVAGGVATPAAAVGAIGGALIGGVAAAMNEDQLTELTANAQVQARMAREEFGEQAAILSALGNYSGVGLRLVSPLSNAVQGSADVIHGEVGDQQEEFFRTDPATGERMRSGWWTAADIAATVGDSFLQFSNPAGLMVYTGSMAGSIGAQVGLLATEDTKFDYTTGQFHDLEGGSQHAAAYASIGIDAVQLGMARGMTKAANSARSFVDKTPRETLLDRAERVVGLRKEGETAEFMAGFRFTKDAEGNVIRRQPSLEALSPSGFLQRAAVRAKARGIGATRKREELTEGATGIKARIRNDFKAEAQDYYDAAIALTTGSQSRLGAAMLNATGEGTEEFAQALLDPISMDQEIDAQQAAQQAAYGMATGLGMSFAISQFTPPPAERLYARAVESGVFGDTPPSMEQFAMLPPDQQRAMAKVSKKDVAKLKTGDKGLRDAMSYKTAHLGAMGMYALTEGAEAAADRQAASANRALGASLKLGAQVTGDATDSRGDKRPDSGLTDEIRYSGRRLLLETGKQVQFNENALDQARQELRTETARSNDTSLPEADRNKAAQNVAELTDEIALRETAAKVAPGLARLLQRMVGQVEAARADIATDPVTWRQTILETNYRLRVMYDGQGSQLFSPEEAAATGLTPEQLDASLQSLIEHHEIRHPQLGRASNLILAPQIGFTHEMGQDHGSAELHPSVWKILNADADGDLISAMRDRRLSPAARAELRRGDQFLVSNPDGTVSVVIANLDSDPAMLRRISRATAADLDQTEFGAVLNAFAELEQILLKRYEGLGGRAGRILAIRKLVHGLMSNDIDARQTFLDYMANNHRSEIGDLGPEPEWTWISRQISAKVEQAQIAIASVQHTYAAPGDPEPKVFSPQAVFLREMAVTEASDMGTGLQTILETDSRLRASQSVHYSMWAALMDVVTGRLDAQGLPPRAFERLVSYYEGHSNDSYDSRVDRFDDTRVVENRVLQDLRRVLAASPEGEAMLAKHGDAAVLMLAMTRVPDIRPGQGFGPNNVTFLQLTLRRVVKEEANAYRGNDEAVLNNFKRLERLTHPANGQGGRAVPGQEALLEVFGDESLQSIVGNDAIYLGGSGRTMRDLLRDLLDMETSARAEKVKGWTRRAAYLGRKERNDPPYDIHELMSGDISAYRVVVDAVRSVSNQAEPQRERRGEGTRVALVDAFKGLNQMLVEFATTLPDETTGGRLSKAEFAELGRKKDADGRTIGRGEQMLYMLNSLAPGVRAQFMDLFADSLQFGLVRVLPDTGQLQATSWFLDILNEADAEAAVAKYYVFNNVLVPFLAIADREMQSAKATETKNVREAARRQERIVELQGHMAREKTRGASQDALDALAERLARQVEEAAAKDERDMKRGKRAPLEFAKLKTTEQRVMYSLVGVDNGLRLRAFVSELLGAGTVDAVSAILNNPAYRRSGAKVTPFASDVAAVDFTVQRAWQGDQSGAVQREAITNLAQTVTRVSGKLRDLLKTQDADTELANRLVTALNAQINTPGYNNRLSDPDVQKANSLVALVRRQHFISTTLGAQGRDDMIAATQTGEVKFHEKGQSDKALSPGGNAITSGEGGGVTTSTERTISDVTAYHEREVMTNPSLLMSRRQMKIQLDNGQIIDWQGLPQFPSEADFLALSLRMAHLLADPATAGLAKEMISLQTKEPTDYGLSTASVPWGPVRGANVEPNSLAHILESADLSYLAPNNDNGSFTADQAKRFLQVIDSVIARSVYRGTQEEQNAGFYSTLRVVQEFVTAYTSNMQLRPGQSRQAQFDKVRDTAYKGVAQALVMFSQLDTNDTTSPAVQGTPIAGRLQQALLEIKNQLDADSARRGTKLPAAEISQILAKASNTEFRQFYTEQLESLQQAYVEQLQALDPTAAGTTAEQARLHQALQARLAKLESLISQGLDHLDVQAVVASFTTTDPDPAVEAQKQANLLAFLGPRVSSLLGSQLTAYEDVVSAVAEFGRTGALPTLEAGTWEELTLRAATLSLEEKTRALPSSMALTVLDGKDDDLVRWWDPTRFSLLSNLTTPMVLNATSYVLQQTGYGLHLTAETAARNVVNGLFGDNMPDFLPTSVGNQVAARNQMLSAGPEAAVGVPGDIPPRQRVLDQATRVQKNLPDDGLATMTTVGMLSRSFIGPTFVPPAGFSLSLIDDEDILAGRFITTAPPADPVVGTVTLPSGLSMIYRDDQGQLQPYDLLADGAADPWGRRDTAEDDAIANSTKRVTSAAQIRAAIERAKKTLGITDGRIQTIHLNMFDPRNRPEGGQWAHNLFFSGVGRGGQESTYGSLAAEYLGAPGATYAALTQYPIDALKKQTSVSKIVPHLDVVEPATDNIYDQLSDLARQALDHKTEVPDHLGDFNALMEILRLHTVVEGTRPDGTKQRMDANRAIALQEAGNTEFASFERIDLSIPTRDRIYGQPFGYSTVGSAYSQDQISNETVVTEELLEARGLSELGRSGSFSQSLMAYRAVPTPASRAQQREGLRSADPRQFEAWKVDAANKAEERIKEGFDSTQARELAMAELNRTELGVQIIMAASAGLPAPIVGTAQDAATETARRLLLNQLGVDTEDPNAALFLFRPNGNHNPVKGILNEITDKKKGMSPGYEDTVVMSLDDYTQNFGTYEDILRAASGDLEKMMDRGITVHFAFANGGLARLAQDLRNVAALNPYYEVSGAFSVRPLSQDLQRQTPNERALDSVYSEVHGVEVSAIHFGIATDDLPQLHENNSIYNSRDYQRFGVTQRANILEFRPEGFFEPALLEERDVARRKVLDALNDPVRLKELARRGGSGAQSALETLRTTLAGGGWPLSVGNEYGYGAFDITINADGDVYLRRHGFQVPDDLSEQLGLDANGNPFDPRSGEPAGIAVASGQGDPGLTTHVGTIQAIRPSQLGGGGMVELAIELQQEFAKLIYEGTGFKVNASPMPMNMAPPERGLGPHGVPISMFDGLAAMDSKGVNSVRVDSMQNAMLAFGWDFSDQAIEYFTGVKPDDTNRAVLTDEMLRQMNAIARLQGSGLDASDIAAAALAGSMADSYGPLLMGHLSDTLGLQQVAWLPSAGTAPPPKDDPVMVIGEAMVAALLTPGVTPGHLLQRAGLLDHDRRTAPYGTKVYGPPRIFSDLLTDYSYPEFQAQMREHFNNKLGRFADSQGNRMYEMDDTFRITVRLAEFQGTKSVAVRGYLTLLQPEIDDKHPDFLVMSEGSNTSSGVTLFAASQASMFFNSRLLDGRTDNPVGRVIYGPNGPGSSGKATDIWRNVTQAVKPGSVPLTTAGEEGYTRRARDRFALYHRPLDLAQGDMDDKTYATAVSAAHKARADFASRLLGEAGYTLEVDSLVRQALGVRGVVEGSAEVESPVSPQLYVDTLAKMSKNLDEGIFPTIGLYGTQLPEGSFVELLHQLNTSGKRKGTAWMPARAKGRGSVPVGKNLEDWLAAAYGQFEQSPTPFRTLFRLDTDGAWQSYRSIRGSWQGGPPSTSGLVNAQLMGDAYNELVSSLDPLMQAKLESLLELGARDISLQKFLGTTELPADEGGVGTEPMTLAKRIEYIESYAKKNNLRDGGTVKPADYVAYGHTRADANTKTHQWLQDLTHARIGLALFNPALALAAIPESFARNAVDGLASLILGTSTGKTATAAAAVGEKLGGTPRLSGLERTMIKNLEAKLSRDPRFLEMMYQEMYYLQQIEGAGTNRLSRALAKFARAGGQMQDISMRKFSRRVARRYVQSAIHEVLVDADNVHSIPALVNALDNDPLYLQKLSPSERTPFGAGRVTPHTAGLNAVSQIKSTRLNVVGKTGRGVWDPLTHNDSTTIALAGHLLKWPLVFANYNAGAAMFITGTGVVGDWVAMTLHGRRNFLGKMQRRLAGQAELYDAETDGYFDMSDILEGLDLTRSGLRSGITFAGYMAYLMTGGLGLLGEDEEERRRRLLATSHGAPVLIDPSDPMSDWRSTPFISMDWLPDPLDSLFDVTDQDGNSQSLMAPHWMIKQFVSPLVGIERFMSTGDLNQIKWGFEEAFSVMPHSVGRMRKDAEELADRLGEKAAAEAGKGDEADHVEVNKLLISIVGVYQRLLTESSFINTLRNGSDKYDRDPYALVKTDEAGNIVLDDRGNPERSDSLNPYVDDEGKVAKAYADRDPWNAMWHQMAESSATLALFSSLVTSPTDIGESTFWRRNMAVKQRNIDLNELTDDEAAGLILKAMDAEGGAPALSESEAVSLIRNQIVDQTGTFAGTSTAQLSDQAKALAASAAGQSSVVLPDVEARAIVEGLYKGYVDLDSRSLLGVYMDQEQRDRVQKILVDELIEEGISWGLDPMSAKVRASRIWHGNTMEDAEQIGLKEILYSDKIESKPTINYNQLNTTYMQGPDGRFYATAVQRDSFLEAFGINPVGQRPLVNTEAGMHVDQRLNSTDAIVGLNTGLRALERNLGAPVESNDKALDAAFQRTYQEQSGSGSAYRRGSYYGSGYRRRSGGGGYRSYGSGGFTPYYTRMYGPSRLQSPYVDNIPYVNTSNPIIRRASIRRERYSSERGRLNQWQ